MLIGIEDEKLDVVDALVHHAVDRVGPRSADADDDDAGYGFEII